MQITEVQSELGKESEAMIKSQIMSLKKLDNLDTQSKERDPITNLVRGGFDIDKKKRY